VRGPSLSYSAAESFLSDVSVIGTRPAHHGPTRGTKSVGSATKFTDSKN
jgi:hypothetical protein